MMSHIKLNVGASPIWYKESWLVLDHKLSRKDKNAIQGDAENIPCGDNNCSIIFCSHMLERVPQAKVILIIKEFYRVLKQGGLLRILVPDLYKLAKAYVNGDKTFFEKALAEDENIRTDLGHGGSFMNFIVSPGQDTVLFNKDLDQFIAGYAHLYAYDFKMLKTILNRCGFNKIQQKEFCNSAIEELKEPLHVDGLPAEWNILNQKFYNKHGLVHKYENGDYNINFSITGFDRDPETSLIVEAYKSEIKENSKNCGNNFDNYSRSLLYDKHFTQRLKELDIDYD